MDDLVEDYLSLVRVSGQHVPVDLSLLVTQCLEDITPPLLTAAIALQLDTLDHLGTVMAHANTFRRVVVNLVHNAIDAMPQGGDAHAPGTPAGHDGVARRV
jgi:signal transduction histidine kinase